MAKYIEQEAVLKIIGDNCPPDKCGYNTEEEMGAGAACYYIRKDVEKIPTADVVEVVRCKDCKHFQPCFVMTSDGERRPYTEEEIKNGKIVTGDVGINCGSRCERFGYWDENKIPVWYNENDFCSYGERKE